MPTVVQLAASLFVGGPERQMLGLAQALPSAYTTIFVSFSEKGRSSAFLEEARRLGYQAEALRHDTPRLFAARRELKALLRAVRADVVCAHGYKTDLLGLWAARKLGIPAIAVSHGWTAQDFKVRVYERLDRLCLRRMDRVACVSQKQAERVIASGMSPERVVVIRDAVHAGRFAELDPTCRDKLRDFFPEPPARIVGAAGRLSPEKGFCHLIDAAGTIARRDTETGFILFGDGPLRETLAAQIRHHGLEKRFIMAGHRTDLDTMLPYLDLMVLPSYTEGLPNVILEAFAAGVPVVATAVGGTPEIVEDGVNGFLVSPGDPTALARQMVLALESAAKRRAMGVQGRLKIQSDFTFAGQSLLYQKLFASLSLPGTSSTDQQRRVPEQVSWDSAPSARPVHVGEKA